jgi:hypothetical protein
VIPPAAREAALHGQPAWPQSRGQGAESPLGEDLRHEINDLRKQIAELALERDVLMRSLALWARESIGPGSQGG